MIIHFNSTSYEAQELNGLRRHDFGKTTHFSRQPQVQKPTDLADFLKRHNGLTIVEDEASYRIYTDPFRTIPAFVVQDKSGRWSLYTDFEKIYEAPNVDLALDPVGFWEILLFEGGVWSRTLYKNVQQLPGAAVLALSKRDGRIAVSRYWDFHIPEDRNIKSDDMAAEGLRERIQAIFDRLDPGQPYVLGLSGGLDSRITLAFLSEAVAREQIRLFTYGFDPRILEYTLARQIASALALREPEFHRLTVDSYRRALSSLPRLSGGQISIQHCHMYDYFAARREELEGYTNLSTFYTDAVFGWATSAEKRGDGVEDSGWFQTLRSVDGTDTEVREAIEQDIRMALGGYSRDANYSDIDEYKYLIERNQKFHLYLAYVQGKVIPCIPLYADYDLLEYAVSIPLRIRTQKRLIDYLLEKYFPQIALGAIGTLSSRQFHADMFGFASDAGWRRWLGFKALNYTNSLMRIMTHGKAQLLNVYQTEEHERLLYRYFGDDLAEACKILVQNGLMRSEQGEKCAKLPLRGTGGQKLGLIGIASLVREAPSWNLVGT